MERPISFMSRGFRLSAVMHEPDSEVAKRCGVLICNAGLQAKAGPFRLGVRLARKLTRIGYHVLRFDYPGIGDSEGMLKTPDASVTVPRRALPSRVFETSITTPGRGSPFMSLIVPRRVPVLWAAARIGRARHSDPRIAKRPPWRKIALIQFPMAAS